MTLFDICFTGAVLATFVAATSVSLDLSSTESDSPTLAKTVFSSSMRMVLAVGVEGTGHDFVLQVHDHMFDTNDELPRLSSDDTIKIGSYRVQHVMGRDVHYYSEVINRARSQMRNMAKRGEELPPPGTIVLMHGKYSYPMGTGPDKVMKYLDLPMLANVAEEEGVDFRVLYLRRPIKGILIADTVHRAIQNCLGDEDTTTPEERYMQYMQILLTDTAVMHSFLAELDPAFVVCHDYDRLGDADQASIVADHLAPNADVAELLKASFVETANAHNGSTETLLYEGAGVIASRLQRKLDAFESTLCARR